MPSNGHTRAFGSVECFLPSDRLVKTRTSTLPPVQSREQEGIKLFQSFIVPLRNPFVLANFSMMTRSTIHMSSENHSTIQYKYLHSNMGLDHTCQLSCDIAFPCTRALQTSPTVFGIVLTPSGPCSSAEARVGMARVNVTAISGKYNRTLTAVSSSCNRTHSAIPARTTT